MYTVHADIYFIYVFSLCTTIISPFPRSLINLSLRVNTFQRSSSTQDSQSEAGGSCCFCHISQLHGITPDEIMTCVSVCA